MVSSSFVKASLEGLEFVMLLSTSILVFGQQIQSQKREKTLLLKKITSFASHIFTFCKNVTCSGQKLTTFWCSV
jgi:hypothetical protein